MNDDFNTAKVVANLFDIAPVINAIKDGHIAPGAVDGETLQLMKDKMKTWLEDILGLRSINESDTTIVKGLMDLIIEIRKEARADKNWAMSDKIRNKLTEIGIQLKDEKTGAINWTM